MANKTATTGAVFIPKIWSNKALRARESKLVLAKRVWRADDEVNEFGDIVHFPVLPRYTARDKVADTAITYESDTESEVLLTVDKYKYNGVRVESILKAQSKLNLIDAYTTSIGNALARAVDLQIAQQYAFAANTVAGGAGVTDAMVIQAIEYLDVVDAPMEDRVFAIHPYFMSDVRALAKFAEYNSRGSAGLAAGGSGGYVSSIYGIDTEMTTNLVDVAGTPNSRKNLLFQKEGIGLAMQKDVSIERDRDVDHIADKVVGWNLFGVKTLRPDHIVNISLND